MGMRGAWHRTASGLWHHLRCHMWKKKQRPLCKQEGGVGLGEGRKERTKKHAAVTTGHDLLFWFGSLNRHRRTRTDTDTRTTSMQTEACTDRRTDTRTRTHTHTNTHTDSHAHEHTGHRHTDGHEQVDGESKQHNEFHVRVHETGKFAARKSEQMGE